jgi:selenocysteine-specific elongation factor
VISRLETLAAGAPEDLLLQTLEGQTALTAQQLSSLSGLGMHETTSVIETLSTQGEVLPLRDGWLMARAVWARLSGLIARELRAYHAAYPLRPGMPREALRSRLHLDGKLFSQMVGYAAQSGLLADDETSIRLPDHSVQFNDAEQAAIDRLWGIIRSNPFAPPSVKETVSMVGEEVLQALIDQGKLVTISADVLFDADTYQQLVHGVEQFIETQGSITVAQARDLFDTSRKYILPFLEHLDAAGKTRRRGDERVLKHSSQ